MPGLGDLDPTCLWALNFDRSTYHYTSRRPDQAGLERRIREICETRVRYGYRRVQVWTRGMGRQHQANLPHLQGLGPAIAEQDPEA